MPKPPAPLGFDHSGIGAALKGRLRVPPNQREYSWEVEHVSDLMEDLANAIQANKPTYFLGTIVLTSHDVPEVVDGQQRLATTTILLAAIRDYMYAQKEEMLYQSIESEFLYIVDRDKKEIVPRLTLNNDDNEYFQKRILSRSDSKERAACSATKDSHKRIDVAANIAADRVNLIVTGHREANRVTRLNEWLGYIEKNAAVIIVTAPNDLNAYVMFETLNDRGLRTSQADLVKNYLFGESDDRIDEAQNKWSEMKASLEPLDIDDVVLIYLRHLTRALHGPTEDKEIFEKIQKAVSGRNRSVEFLQNLAEYADDYAAILNRTHKKWNGYPSTIRGHVEIMRELRVAQIRPLMLAVAHHFTAKEASIAFKQFVSWTVRFLIAGGGRGGTAERNFASAAQQVVAGAITTAADLQSSLKEIIPQDGEFVAAFSTARVSRSYLARYYLRAMESKHRSDNDNPELAPVEDTSVLNLEHILPQNPEDNWKHIDPETTAAYSKRIGNMVLLRAEDNSVAGNEKFAVKKPVFAKSPLVLTNSIDEYSDWGPNEINDRQAKLAELAKDTWPL